MFAAQCSLNSGSPGQSGKLAGGAVYLGIAGERRGVESGLTLKAQTRLRRGEPALVHAHAQAVQIKAAFNVELQGASLFGQRA